MSFKNYQVIKNFISEKECNQLINDAIQIKDEDFLNIQTKRLFLSSSSLEMQMLINKYISWKKLVNILDSQEFLEKCCDTLNIKFKLKKVNFFNKNINTSSDGYYLEFKKNGNKRLKDLTLKALIKYSLIRFFRFILRNIKFSKIFYLNRIPCELLFDYSKADNGYYNDVHKDSDSRLIIFLLYLNSIDGEGGSLQFYKKDGQNNLSLVESIQPEPGKLVIFSNNDDSYHGVKNMSGSSKMRHFLYGSFTSLNEKNPLVKKKITKTEFHLYE